MRRARVAAAFNEKAILAFRESSKLSGIILLNRHGRKLSRGIVAVAIATLVIQSCAYPEPAPYYAPQPSTFDRAWNAALGAAQDEGVQITSEDRASGRISGLRGEQAVTIDARTQADGNVRLEIGVRGPKGADPGLAGRISRAYDRRMGR